MPRVLDLYSGMGGLSLGFALALNDVEIFGLDIDKHAVETYNYNLKRFNASAVVQDVLKWEPEGEFDMVIGGAPCQPFSLAVNPKYGKFGKSHPLYPTFPRFFDVVLALKPKVFLLENVKGLVTSKYKSLLEEQLRRVEGEYVVKYQVLNAAYYGVPQRRERLFILGVRRDLGVKPSFPPQTHAEVEKAALDGKVFKWVTVAEAIGDLLLTPLENYPKKLIQTNPEHGKPLDMDKPSRTVKVDGRGGDFTFDTMLIPLTPEQVERIRREREDTTRHLAKMEFPDNLDKPSRTISSHTIEGSKRETIVVPFGSSYLSPEVVERILNSGVGLRIHELDKPGKTVKGVTGGPQNAETYIAVHTEAGTYYRRLMVRECLRLQSFPDWWSFPQGVSTSRKYKLVGEAVPPILAYRLAIHVGRLLGWEVREPPKPEDWQLPYFHRAFVDYFHKPVGDDV